MDDAENKEQLLQESPPGCLKVFVSFSSVMLGGFLILYFFLSTRLGAFIEINILFNGGFILAFACLIYATFARRSRRPMWWLCFIGVICGLLYEGGCYAAAASAGKAFGGGRDDSQANRIILAAACIAAVWGIILLALRPAKGGKNSDSEKN